MSGANLWTIATRVKYEFRKRAWYVACAESLKFDRVEDASLESYFERNSRRKLRRGEIGKLA